MTSHSSSSLSSSSSSEKEAASSDWSLAHPTSSPNVGNMTLKRGRYSSSLSKEESAEDRSVCYTNENNQHEEGEAEWLSSAELHVIARRYGGTAIQYRAKYHNGNRIIIDSAVPVSRRDKINAKPHKAMIYPGDLVVQSRYVSAIGNAGGSTYSFVRFRMPGNFKQSKYNRRSIYDSTRPSLVKPREDSACPLFILDQSLSEVDRKMVKEFVQTSEPGKNPLQIFPNLSIAGPDMKEINEDIERDESQCRRTGIKVPVRHSFVKDEPLTINKWENNEEQTVAHTSIPYSIMRNSQRNLLSKNFNRETGQNFETSAQHSVEINREPLPSASLNDANSENGKDCEIPYILSNILNPRSSYEFQAKSVSLKNKVSNEADSDLVENYKISSMSSIMSKSRSTIEIDSEVESLENIQIDFATSKTGRDYGTCSTSSNLSKSRSSMEVDLFVPSKPRLDAKPNQSILRNSFKKDSTEKGTSIVNKQLTGKWQVTSNTSHLSNFSNPEQSKDDVHNAMNKITPSTLAHSGKKEGSRTDKIRNRVHRLKRKLQYPTSQQLQYTKRLGRMHDQRHLRDVYSIEVRSPRLHFAYIEGFHTTMLNENKPKHISGRIIELPGIIRKGEWTTYLAPDLSPKNSSSTQIMYRNLSMFVPSLSCDIDGITVSTIHANVHRIETMAQQGIIEVDEYTPSSSIYGKICSLSIAAFDGFDTCSDFIQNHNKVTHKILNGIPSCKNSSGFSPIFNLDVGEHDSYSNVIGSSFECNFDLDWNITIRVATDEASTEVIAVDVSIGNLDESDNSYSSSSSIVDQSVAESRRKRHTVPPQLTSELLQKHCERYKPSLSLPLSIASSSSSNSHTSYDTISQNKSTQNSRTNSECNTEFRHSGKIDSLSSDCIESRIPNQSRHIGCKQYQATNNSKLFGSNNTFIRQCKRKRESPQTTIQCKKKLNGCNANHDNVSCPSLSNKKEKNSSIFYDLGTDFSFVQANKMKKETLIANDVISLSHFSVGASTVLNFAAARWKSISIHNNRSLTTGVDDTTSILHQKASISSSSLCPDSTTYSSRMIPVNITRENTVTELPKEIKIKDLDTFGDRMATRISNPGRRLFSQPIPDLLNVFYGLVDIEEIENIVIENTKNFFAPNMEVTHLQQIFLYDDFICNNECDTIDDNLSTNSGCSRRHPSINLSYIQNAFYGLHDFDSDSYLDSGDDECLDVLMQEKSVAAGSRIHAFLSILHDFLHRDNSD